MQSITQECTVIINLKKSTFPSGSVSVCWICPYCDMKTYKLSSNLWLKLKYWMYRGWDVSWRLHLFLPHVRFHYYLCSRVSENLIELTLFSSVCIDITQVPVGTQFQVIGSTSAEPASGGRHWINRFSQHEIVANLIIREERASFASSTSCGKLMKRWEQWRMIKGSAAELRGGEQQYFDLQPEALSLKSAPMSKLSAISSSP